MSKIKECLMCGAKIKSVTERSEGEEHVFYSVVCFKCGFEGPMYLDRDQAINGWNYAHVVSKIQQNKPVSVPIEEIEEGGENAGSN